MVHLVCVRELQIEEIHLFMRVKMWPCVPCPGIHLDESAKRDLHIDTQWSTMKYNQQLVLIYNSRLAVGHAAPETRKCHQVSAHSS